MFSTGSGGLNPVFVQKRGRLVYWLSGSGLQSMLNVLEVMQSTILTKITTNMKLEHILIFYNKFKT